MCGKGQEVSQGLAGKWIPTYVERTRLIMRHMEMERNREIEKCKEMEKYREMERNAC